MSPVNPCWEVREAHALPFAAQPSSRALPSFFCGGQARTGGQHLGCLSSLALRTEPPGHTSALSSTLWGEYCTATRHATFLLPPSMMPTWLPLAFGHCDSLPGRAGSVAGQCFSRSAAEREVELGIRAHPNSLSFLRSGL